MPCHPTPPLGGRVVLIVQRSWIIASGLAIAFKAAGAKVLVAKNLRSDWALADHPHLSAAVLDSGSRELCLRLKARGIPYLFYSGSDHIEDEFATAPTVQKPARPAEVVARMQQLLS